MSQRLQNISHGSQICLTITELVAGAPSSGPQARLDWANQVLALPPAYQEIGADIVRQTLGPSAAADTAQPPAAAAAADPASLAAAPPRAPDPGSAAAVTATPVPVPIPTPAAAAVPERAPGTPTPVAAAPPVSATAAADAVPQPPHPQANAAAALPPVEDVPLIGGNLSPDPLPTPIATFAPTRTPAAAALPASVCSIHLGQLDCQLCAHST